MCSNQQGSHLLLDQDRMEGSDKDLQEHLFLLMVSQQTMAMDQVLRKTKDLEAQKILKVH